MTELNYLSYTKAKPLIHEADILLFRGSGIVSDFIRRAGEGLYTHVAIASWHSSHLECVEFREWKGGRTTRLSRQVEQYSNLIDVYRIKSPQPCLKFNPDHNVISISSIELDANAISECMRAMTGLPYGWKRIWWIAKHKLPFLRFLYDIESITKDDGQVIYPVCSTAVASCCSASGYDLVPNRSDQWTEPSDIARSSLIQYLFTLIWENSDFTP